MAPTAQVATRLEKEARAAAMRPLSCTDPKVAPCSYFLKCFRLPARAHGSRSTHGGRPTRNRPAYFPVKNGCIDDKGACMVRRRQRERSCSKCCCTNSGPTVAFAIGVGQRAAPGADYWSSSPVAERRDGLVRSYRHLMTTARAVNREATTMVQAPRHS